MKIRKIECPHNNCQRKFDVVVTEEQVETILNQGNEYITITTTCPSCNKGVQIAVSVDYTIDASTDNILCAAVPTDRS